MAVSSILELLTGKVLLDDAFRAYLYADPVGAAASLGVTFSDELVAWISEVENQEALEASVQNAQALPLPSAIVWRPYPGSPAPGGMINPSSPTMGE